MSETHSDPADDASSPGEESPRSLALRKQQALDRLRDDMDLWVATAGRDGTPCLVPLSFWWDDTHVWFSTRTTNPTGRNLTPSGQVRLSLGHPRDVVLVEGTADHVPGAELPSEAAEGFIGKCVWDPRTSHSSYAFFRVTPAVIQAWGTVAEMRDRTLMRDGTWLL